MFPDIGFTIKRINFEEESHVLIVENTLFVSLELLDIDLFQTYQAIVESHLRMQKD